MCWLLAIPLPILFLTPYVSFQFNPIFGTWSYNGKFPNSMFFDRLNYYRLYLTFGGLMLALAIYAFLVVYLIYQVSKLCFIYYRRELVYINKNIEDVYFMHLILDK